jgi:Ser-tRNA(Ala) deacylase AlaX
MKSCVISDSHSGEEVNIGLPGCKAVYSPVRRYKSFREHTACTLMAEVCMYGVTTLNTNIDISHYFSNTQYLIPYKHSIVLIF